RRSRRRAAWAGCARTRRSARLEAAGRPLLSAPGRPPPSSTPWPRSPVSTVLAPGTSGPGAEPDAGRGRGGSAELPRQDQRGQLAGPLAEVGPAADSQVQGGQGAGGELGGEDVAL